MLSIIPHSRPYITSEDIAAVARILERGDLVATNLTSDFERAMAHYLAREHAVATSSGTASIFAVLSSLGVGQGDQVVIPSYVCSSLLHAVRLTGAEAVIVDSGRDGAHIDADSVRTVLSSRTAAIIVPHLFGGIAPVEDIVSLGVPVIEDVAMSLGAGRAGRKTGNMGSVAAVCSFYATKMLAAGEGGMVLTDDAGLADRVRDMVRYDNTHDARMHFNFKMTGMAAALGLSQFGRLDDFIARRRELAQRYTAALSACDIVLPAFDEGERHVYYRYVIDTDDVEGIRASLRGRCIMAERPVYEPLSRFPGILAACPVAERTWARALSLPLYPSMTDDEAARVVAATRESLEG